jgi:hypothetical protein
MSMPDEPDPSKDVKIRWVQPESFPCRGANKVRDEERRNPASERAEVFAIDLHSSSVQSALDWAEAYRAGESPQDPPVCLVAYGREIKPEEQARLALAGIHAIDLFRENLGLQGPSSGMLIDLIRALVMPHTPVVTGPSPSRTGPSSGDWQIYTTQPGHVPESALNAQFEELSRDDRPWWERES